MRISMPNSGTTMTILLKDVLYAPKMGVTLVSIGKIDAAGYATLFHKSQLQIFSSRKEEKLLAQIKMKNGLYRVEHEKDVELTVAVIPEVVWYDSLCRSLAEIGFARSTADPAVFYVQVGADVVVLAIHIDD